MLNLAQIYWDWRNKPKPAQLYIKTDMGHTVRKFNDKWVVVDNRATNKYKDLTGPYSWKYGDTWFRDCLASREEIEARFGKILDSEEK